MSLFASSTCSAYFVSGESVLSVMATTVAPRSEAYFSAFTAFLEYRGKLMPISASPSPMCTICLLYTSDSPKILERMLDGPNTPMSMMATIKIVMLPSMIDQRLLEQPF